MVVVHVVAFKVNKTATAQQVQAMIEGVRSLRELKGVISIKVGVQDSRIYPEYFDRSHGYTHSLLVELESAEALRNYASNPKHLTVVKELIAPIVSMSENLAIDYTDFTVDNHTSSSNLPTWCQFPHTTSVLGVIGALLVGVFIGSKLK